MDDTTVTGARRDLGLRLASIREAAGQTQAGLAKATSYARSTVANAEVGQGAARLFWERCDSALDQNGQLLEAYERVERLRRELQRQAEERTRAERDAQAQPLGQYRPFGGPPAQSALLNDTSHQVANMLRATLASPTTDDSASASITQVKHELEERALTAHVDTRSDRLPSMTLIGGYAGSGKSEFARFLSRITGWTIFDKDSLTRALVEQLLLSLGCDPSDRQTDVYQARVRPHEYECLLDQGLENLESGISVILTAPFLREFSDPNWLRRVQNKCAAHDAELTVVWVKCDLESMHDYLRFRGASRDSWKLANWAEYIGAIDPNFEPDFPHCTVDNRLNAATALSEQARNLVNGRTAPRVQYS